MIVRRLVALLTAVTMLHLAVVAGDSACAFHGVNGRQAPMQDGADATRHTMPMDGHVMPPAVAADVPVISAGPVTEGGTPPCEIPADQHCCEALVGGGCSVASAVASMREDLPSALPSATRIRQAVHDAPASFASAPEPPPPKA